MAGQPTLTDVNAPDVSAAAPEARERDRARRPFWKSWRSLWVWVPVVLVVAMGVGVAVMLPKVQDVYTRAMTVREELEPAMPLASTAQAQLLATDLAGADATIAQMATHTAAARASASGDAWMQFEGFPWAGENLRAVRVAAESADVLVNDALAPATSFRIESLAPVDGRIDTGVLTELSGTVQGIAETIDSVRAELATIDRGSLIDQVRSGIDQLDAALDTVEPIIDPAERALQVLPAALGADGPRNYLVMVQNNAESRGTGGNPASLLMLTVTDGAIEITQQASSTDFRNGRPEPIIELRPGTAALYGDKVGRWMQDVTLTPSFSESAEIMAAFWAEPFGTPIDATVSVDPVALSYLLHATGPVTLTDGSVLTADNAVQKLLNQVYTDYDDLPPAEQGIAHDLYFAAAAESIFGALTGGSDPKVLLEQLIRGVDEGRIMYVPASEAEASVLAGSRILGELPDSNAGVTVLGAYVNDISEGKLNFYTDTSVVVRSDVCEASGAPTFATEFTITNTLSAADVDGLASYISPARFFPKGVVVSDIVLYGPVGATFDSATVNGAAVGVSAVAHLGRPAVKINVTTAPGETATVGAVFTGADGEYGPVEVWHTPMVRETPVDVDGAVCSGG